jgi:hypothetical protein
MQVGVIFDGVHVVQRKSNVVQNSISYIEWNMKYEFNEHMKISFGGNSLRLYVSDDPEFLWKPVP